MCTCFWQDCVDEIGIWKKFMIAGVGVGRTFYKILIAIKIFCEFLTFSNIFVNFTKIKNMQKMIANYVETLTPVSLQRLSSTLGIIKMDLRGSVKEDLTEAIYFLIFIKTLVSNLTLSLFKWKEFYLILIFVLLSFVLLFQTNCIVSLHYHHITLYCYSIYSKNCNLIYQLNLKSFSSLAIETLFLWFLCFICFYYEHNIFSFLQHCIQYI